MEDGEMPRMLKYGESKRTRIMMQLYRTSLPVLDLENFRPMDFCSTECTSILYNFLIFVQQMHNCVFVGQL